MPTLTVTVEDENDDPIPNVKVTVFTHHRTLSKTWEEERTDEDGEATFDIEEHHLVDIHVYGEAEVEDMEIGLDDEEVTITISGDDD